MADRHNAFLFNTDALIYWVCKDSPYNAEVAFLINSTLRNDGALYAVPSSLNEVYRFLCDHANEAIARSSIQIIANMFDLVELNAELIERAIDSSEVDFENALKRVAAESLQVDAIISYDERAFSNSIIPRLTALEAIKLSTQ